ncbi:MAG: hypothetical protein AAF611_14070 [Bacteroidota bacterium]
MKFIYYTNNIVYSSTIVLYLTLVLFVLGMYMQILLGIIQILLFFVLLFNYDKFSKNIQNHLVTYGILTLVFLLWFFNFYKYTDFGMPIIILGPMSLGTYFTYIVYQLKQKVL